MQTNEYVIIFVIVLLSFDTTLFMQSLISQPIFSCQIIGFLVGNYTVGLTIGIVAQLFSLSYIPIGGAKIPDEQFAANILTLLLADVQIYHEEIIGKMLPLLVAISVVFMWVTYLERYFTTRYMKYVPYEKVNFSKMAFYSFAFHFVLYTLATTIIYFALINIKFYYLRNFIFDGSQLYYFFIFYSLGSLAYKYYKRGFHL